MGQGHDRGEHSRRRNEYWRAQRRARGAGWLHAADCAALPALVQSSPLSRPRLRADQVRPITMLAKIPNVLVVRKDLATATLQQLIDYGKANPGKLSYASQGVGSTAHLSAAQLEVQTGIKMLHVPYRGAQPALTDVVAGHVDMFFDTLATSVPLYRDNKVKLMGVADLKRAGVVPEVPTISEAGLPGFKS